MSRTFLRFLLIATGVLFFSYASLAAAPQPGILRVHGEVMPVARLVVEAQGQVAERGSGRRLSLNFGEVDAQGVHRNPIGRSARSRRFPEAYYQADVRIQVQLSGNQSPATLIVSQVGGGPLQEYLYETDQHIDFDRIRDFRPIPPEPQRQIAVANLNPGSHELLRQLVLRVPGNLPGGTKQALVRYNLEVRP